MTRVEYEDAKQALYDRFRHSNREIVICYVFSEKEQRYFIGFYEDFTFEVFGEEQWLETGQWVENYKQHISMKFRLEDLSHILAGFNGEFLERVE